MHALKSSPVPNWVLFSIEELYLRVTLVLVPVIPGIQRVDNKQVIILTCTCM